MASGKSANNLPAHHEGEIMRKKALISVLAGFALVLSACGSAENLLDTSLNAGENSSKDDTQSDKDSASTYDSTDSLKPITLVSHNVYAEFKDKEAVSSRGSYPEIIVNEDYMLEHPKFWASMVNYSDGIAESTKSDIASGGYGSFENDEGSYYYDISAEVLRLDGKVFTAKITEEYAWSDGVEREPFYYYLNYDIDSGKRIWSDEFFDQKDGLDEVIYQAVVDTYPREKDLVNDITEDGTPAALFAISSMVEYDYLPCCILKDQFIVHFGTYSIMDNDNEYDISIPVEDLEDYLNADYADDATGNIDDLVEYTEVTDDTLEGQIYEYDEETDYEDQEEVYVSSVDEFIDAIAPNRHIIMESGTYDITDYVLNPSDEFLDEHPYWAYSPWWSEYGVYNVYNLTIEGEDPEDRPSIVINSPYNDVFVINGSSNVTLSNLIMGHDVQKGECSANVLAIYYSSGISGTNLDLYGSGAYGLFCSSSYNVYIYDSCIHDCTYGIVQIMDDSSEIYFYNSQLINNMEYTMIDNVYNYGYIYFNECTFDGNVGDLFSTYSDPGYITFTDCEFGDTERKFLDEHIDMVNYYEDGGAG